MRTKLVVPIVTALLLTLAPGRSSGSPPRESLPPEVEQAAERLIAVALADDTGYDKLAWLTGRIGHRLSGSVGLERAVEWAAEQMRQDGLENVQVQPVQVPHWVRGRESLTVLEPFEREISMLGLGGSVGTPEGGITADVLVVESFEDLAARADAEVRGRIVLFAVPWEGYGGTVRYRSGGASAAARRGAVAALVRSAGPVSLDTPHTGAMNYESDVERIPAAAIALESSEWLRRVAADGGTVRVRLQMEAATLPDAESANVMGEIVGREIPEEVVVLGGHLDSWDVGQGAHDDGAGCIAALHAVALMRQLGLRPRRTVRVVFWTNEENGLAGGRAYRDALDAVSSHVAAIEMDGGAERPLGFGMSIAGRDSAGGDPTYEVALARAQQIGDLLAGIGAGEMSRGGGGADIGPLTADGVPGFGMRTVGEHYFDWHHTEADTLDKVDPEDFRRNVAALAVLAFALAELPERFGS